MRNEGPSAVRAAYVVASFSFDAGLRASRGLCAKRVCAGLEVEDDRARAGRAHLLRVQRPGELRLERAPRPGLRGRDEEQGDECHCQGGKTDGHGLSIFQAWSETSSRDGSLGREDGPCGPFQCARRRPIIVSRCRCGRKSTDLLRMPEDGAGAPSLDTIESTLTDGYAEALALEAERSRIERRLGEVVRDAGEVEPHNVAAELAQLSERLDTADGELARLRSLLGNLQARRRAVRSPAPRRSRSARRRPPPGCGCRSGAS